MIINCRRHQNDGDGIPHRLARAKFDAQSYSDERLLALLTQIVSQGGTVTLETHDQQQHQYRYGA